MSTQFLLMRDFWLRIEGYEGEYVIDLEKNVFTASYRSFVPEKLQVWYKYSTSICCSRGN
jgi:hypothetical protein